MSKAYGLISRFSEDIDITVFREDLGQEASVPELEALSRKKRQTRLDAIKETCRQYIQNTLAQQFEEAVQGTLAESKVEANVPSVVVDPDDADCQSLLFWYPTVTGITQVDIGPASEGVFAVRFVLGTDSYDALLAIDASLTMTIIDATGNTYTPTAPAATSVLDKFWGAFDKSRLESVMSGAIEDWVVTNAVGGPVFLVVGIVSGPFSASFVTGAIAKVADLMALVIGMVAHSEMLDGILSADEEQQVEQTVGVFNLVAQLPAILADPSDVVKVAGCVAAEVNFLAQSPAAKLGVTFAADGLGKYSMAIEALVD